MKKFSFYQKEYGKIDISAVAAKIDMPEMSVSRIDRTGELSNLLKLDERKDGSRLRTKCIILFPFRKAVRVRKAI